MEKLIVFKEKEFRKKLIEFAEHFQTHSLKACGVSLFSNETGEPIEDVETLVGSFTIPWDETFKG